ncbi:uncharacterized protein LOC132714287 [Ruditapes philippinarum]|uniref:uncharacterized protein LOC132714287 n=1 Tax=Ruditapes philippinarum TaxID=129788 RepID=UPI00295A62A4|nr:uncharacterized protein LOC132714287 [Ruditapes philippinarum]
MGKWISFLVLAGNMLVLASAREIRVTSSACNDYYDMDDVGEDVYLEYSGNRLNKDECHVQFQNFRTFEKQICVKPQKINLSCSTKVEYFRHFISEYLDPAKQFTCGQASFDEWCGPTRTNRLYIVFRTSSSSSSDNIRLHIYLKYLPGKFLKKIFCFSFPRKLMGKFKNIFIMPST